MKIINEVDLPYKVIGEIMDTYIERQYYETMYFGKIEYFEILYKNEKYKVQVRYLKSFTEWMFTK